MNSHEDPVPGPGEIFKDLHRDVPGVDAVKEATVWRKMASEGAEGKKAHGGDGENNMYLTPSETAVLLTHEYSGEVALMLGDGKQRPRARREIRGCWVSVCLSDPPIPEHCHGRQQRWVGSALSGLGVLQPVFPPCRWSAALTPR